MKIKYFEDSDTMYIKLKDEEPHSTKEVNENVLLELDKQGQVVGMTIEHAKKGAKKLDFSFETVAA